VRYKARPGASFGIALSLIEQTIIDQHTDAVRCVKPYFEMLENPERSSDEQDREKVRKIATTMIQQLSEELNAIQEEKEADTDALFAGAETLAELQADALGFAENVLQTGFANPESPGLQRTGIQAVLKAIKVCKATSEQNAPIGTAIALISYASFVVQAMRMHPDDRDIQKDACLVLSTLVATSTELKEKVSELGGMDLVHKAMANHTTDALIQVNGRLVFSANDDRNLESSVFAITEASSSKASNTTWSRVPSSAGGQFVD
jgi:hypothetical protein